MIGIFLYSLIGITSFGNSILDAQKTGFYNVRTNLGRRWRVAMKTPFAVVFGFFDYYGTVVYGKSDVQKFWSGFGYLC